MEYKTDKQTKNLTLRDIHVGDWVQVWSEQAERYSPPLKITQICDDGTIYLVTDDENRCTPWEKNIKDIDALMIEPDILRGFGFEIRMLDDKFGRVLYNGMTTSVIERYYKVTEDWTGSTCRKKTDYYFIQTSNTLFFMHQYIAWVEDKFDIKLEWKGIEK